MGNVLRELQSVDGRLGLCWLGNLSWLVRSRDKLIAFDLDLEDTHAGRDDRRLAPSPLSAADLAPHLDILFVTHEHGDHFGDASAAVLAKRSGCVFVVAAGCEQKARRLGIPAPRLRLARAGENFSVQGVSVEVQRAHHGRVTPDDCGYVVEMAGMRLYQPGDTVLLEDHAALADISVLFVSPTTHNMHVADSVRLIEALRPRYIFPQHYGTYVESERNRFWTRGYPGELADALPDELRKHYHQLEQGEVFNAE
jgi:L-ascorbate metabolism protein UlaG (beta-lactamase superfamily)